MFAYKLLLKHQFKDPIKPKWWCSRINEQLAAQLDKDNRSSLLMKLPELQEKVGLKVTKGLKPAFAVKALF